jgi:hypothetical protein
MSVPTPPEVGVTPPPANIVTNLRSRAIIDQSISGYSMVVGTMEVFLVIPERPTVIPSYALSFALSVG